MKDYYIRAYINSQKGGWIIKTATVCATSRDKAIQKMYRRLTDKAIEVFGTPDGRYNIDFCYEV